MKPPGLNTVVQISVTGHREVIVCRGMIVTGSSSSQWSRDYCVAIDQALVGRATSNPPSKEPDGRQSRWR